MDAVDNRFYRTKDDQMTDTALVAQEAPSDAAALMATITRAATDPAVDAGKMVQLYDLYEKMDSRRAERDFNQALKAAQQEIPPIFKNKKADKNTYADLEQVNDVVVPISTKHGLSMSFGNEDSPMDKHYRVVCFLSHDSGHTRKYHADIPADHSGSKNVTQGFGSTISYGRRYLTLMMFNISTTNEDNDGQSAGNGSITPEQAAILRAMVEDNDFDMLTFLKWANIERLTDLAADKYARAFQALQAKIQAKAAK